jgi:hypothetical protein
MRACLLQIERKSNRTPNGSENPPVKSETTFREILEDPAGEPIEDIPPIETAAYEAPHAVVAVHFGLAPVWAQINPDTGAGR